MKNVIYELVDMIADLEKKLKEKEEDLNAVIDYLHYKGIYITVHNKQLSSELDNIILTDNEINKGSEK